MGTTDEKPSMAPAIAGPAKAAADIEATKADEPDNPTIGRTATQQTAEKKKGPAGGYDRTPPPRTEPGYTVKFIFHRAVNLPFADINTLSSDPYLLVQINTSLPFRHKQDPRLRLRTPTIRQNCNPEWNTQWIVANLPADGFKLKARIYDEDPSDNDDRLGNVHVDVPGLYGDWPGIHEQAYSIKKRMGSKRAYFFRGCAALFNKNVHMSGQLVISAEVLGRTEGVPGGRTFPVGPCQWSKHYSPLVGRLTGTKDPARDVNGKKVERYK